MNQDGSKPSEGTGLNVKVDDVLTLKHFVRVHRLLLSLNKQFKSVAKVHLFPCDAHKVVAPHPEAFDDPLL